MFYNCKCFIRLSVFYKCVISVLLVCYTCVISGYKCLIFVF